jgi:cytidine deaminase
VKLVRDKIGPVAAFKLAVVVDRLPKTRSGKILRGTMVKIADGESYKMPATIDDPAILDEIAEAVTTCRMGYGYAPYSGFQVGPPFAAVRRAAPGLQCRERGLSRRHLRRGRRHRRDDRLGRDSRIAEVAVIADGSEPVPPCGGCRQKLAEFAAPEVVVTMATVDGKTRRMTVGDLLPGRFVADHMDRARPGTS